MSDLVRSHPRNNRIIGATILTLSFLLSACSSGVVKSLGELAVLRNALIKEFGEQDVNVNLNNDRFLSITFVNSPLNEKDPTQRVDRAKKTMAVVLKNYPSVKRLDQIWVGFIRQETKFFFIHYTYGLERFAFDRNGQPLEPPRSVTSEFQPRAVYIDSTNVTDVSIPRIQLSGSTDDGLSLTPNFTVEGDATSAPGPRPKSVSFDFASFSKKDIYSDEVPIQISVDNKVIFKSKGKFNGARSGDGTYSKFLYVKFSYQLFRKLVDSENASIKLGADEFKLKPQQLESLKGMTKYVRE